MKLSVPYLKLRNGRPRWEPGPRLRAAGWHGRDLKDEAGQWLEEGAAIKAAQALNDEVAEWRGSGKRRRTERAPVASATSCRALFERWFASPNFEQLSPRTQGEYRHKASLFLATPFGDAPVRAVTKPQLVGYWEEVYRARGHAMANGIRAVISSAFSYAELIGWRSEQTNPAKGMRRPALEPRVAFWTPDKVQAIITIADEMGRASIADAFIVALHTAQRREDVLGMPERIFDEQRVRLSQMKTKALIDAPMTPALHARVAGIRARRQAGKVVAIGHAASDAPLIVSETTGARYHGQTFGDTFREIREEATRRWPQLCEAARFAPGIDALRFQDLRDTAITRLALAGCTLPEIAAISGHSPPHITQVIKHYLALDTRLADSAIGKLNTWMREQGIAV